jgi:hypothetical protein
LANKQAGFKSVEGEIWYGSMTTKEAMKYRGAVLYNNEGNAPILTKAVLGTC